MPETEVVWTLGASQDFLEAQSGQSDEVIFVHAVDSALELLKSFPGMGAKVSFLKNHRRILVGKDLEYGLYYTTTGQRLIISAMLNLRQSPQSIIDTLNDCGSI
ncbi:MAG: hypothetical protein P1V20_30570 [Verrucomicrobiales bacterium]|nr:hypothetical protein [Verrucomicrobiales bacterium]